MSQHYTNAQVRNLMAAVFEDEEDFEFFVEDHFQEAGAQFEEGMSFKRKAQELAKYCQDNNLTNKLITLISQDFPAKFKESGLPVPAGETAESTESATPAEPEPSPAPQATVPSTNGEEPPDQPQNPDVFISYSTKNLDFVKSLYQHLTNRQISTWFDKQSIEAATQWRESIVKGIMECKVFLLVLSPNSTASVNVRKEVDLAEHHGKKILPVMWQSVNPLPPSFQYQLAGTQYIDFKEKPSEENFDKVVTILNKLLGGSSVSEVATGEPTIQAEGVTPKLTAQSSQTGRGRSGRGRGKTEAVSPIGALTIVMTKVVTQLDEYFNDQEQDEINNELKWLFNAADHFLKVRQHDVDRTAPVPVDVPSSAEKTAEANNAILASLDDFSLGLIDSQVQSTIKQINIYSRNLGIELGKVAELGGETAASVALRNSIKSQQKAIAERTKELAKLMQQCYGVMVYGPNDLLNNLT